MNERVVYTGATFDTPHNGHVNFLRQCRAIAGDQGRVVVSLNTDEFILQYKKRMPVYRYHERESVIRAMRYVDDVIPNIGGSDSKPAIAQVNPNFIVIGSDWAKKDYYAQMEFTQEWLDAKEIVLLYVPYTEGISSTEMRRRMGDL